MLRFVEGEARELPDTLRNAADRVLDHALSADAPHSTAGVEMALRLSGWLATRRRGDTGSRRPFGVVARGYGREGGFVDRARARLWDGDPSPVVAEAYAALAEQADEAREQENREFGRLLAGWPGSGPHEQRLFGVEAVLDRCIAPLARTQPVLVLVVDAMSMAVFRELETPRRRRTASRDTTACARPARPTHRRCSFTRETCARPARPAFPRVVAAIADPDHRVVGVVINAVDDHLAKGDQVRVPWTARHIRPVEELLEACRSCGRAVVLVSDHGHVLERGTALRAVTEGAERWRAPVGQTQPSCERRGKRFATSITASGRASGETVSPATWRVMVL